MKKFLPLFIALLSISQVYAQQSGLLIDENFTGYTNGDLNSKSTGQGGTYPWTALSASYSVDFVQVGNTNWLTYPGYTSGTQYVSLTPNGDVNIGWPFNIHQYTDDPSKRFLGNANLATNIATTFYITFVVNVPSSSGVSSTNRATPTLALQTSNGDNIANFYIAKNGSNLKFGINKNGDNDGDYPTDNYNYNTTYLIVIRYDIVTNSNNDKFYMWVDPLVTSEPTTGSAVESITSTSNNSNNSDGYVGSGSNGVDAIQLFQDDNSANVSIDAIKVAYGGNFSTVAANSAAAWDMLHPAGAPLPVKFGDIKGYAKDKGVEVQWNVYSEINVVKYEIERSSDGVSFSAIGSVTAKNQEGELFYDFFDAMPASGNNYYRIRNVDIDGKSSYSSIVRISLSSSLSAGVSIYPNPATGNHISIQATDLQKGDYVIEIFNTGGQAVYKKQFNHPGGTISQTIVLPTVLQRGIYNIRLSGNGFKQAKSFLVQ